MNTHTAVPVARPTSPPPGWAVSAAAEALGFDRHWPIHSDRDWLRIAVTARHIAAAGSSRPRLPRQQPWS